MNPPAAVVWAGFGLGIVLGAAGRLSAFCLYRGLKESWSGGDGRPLRTFLLALLVALIGSQALEATGWVDFANSPYLRAAFPVPMVVFGGAVFGAGMVLARGCGFRALVLMGGGNLRSLVVLASLGIAGYATLTGILVPMRTALGGIGRIEVVGTPTLPGLVAGIGLHPELARVLVTGVVALALVAFIRRDRAFLRSPALMIGGALIGACVVAGWAITGILGADDFQEVALASASFIMPVGDGLLYLMQASGRALGFGPALAGGVVAGSFVFALLRGEWHTQGFSAERPVGRYLLGGTLMGIGGVLAVGCSIGQGLTGAATLALMTIPAVAGILAGTALMLQLEPAGAASLPDARPTREEIA